MSKRPNRSEADRIDDSAPSMRSERPAWCSQEHVIIVGAGERADGNETIAAGAKCETLHAGSPGITPA
jgi:hypothetical protein